MTPEQIAAKHADRLFASGGRPFTREMIAPHILAAITEATTPQVDCGKAVDRETARRIFDAGFIACGQYGDNQIHYRGEQADRVFMAHMDKLGIIFPAPPPRYIPAVGEFFWWREKGDAKWRGAGKCIGQYGSEIQVYGASLAIGSYDFAPATPPEAP